METCFHMSGTVTARHVKPRGPGLLWKLRNLPHLWSGYWRHIIAQWLGIGHFYATLRALVRHPGGQVIDYGLISTRVVTDAGVAFLVDDWDSGATSITDMHFHASGSGVDGEDPTDAALGTEETTITDRAEGVQSQPAANQLQSVGTQPFTGAAAITEHGIFSVVTESSGVMWDRSLFDAINVVNGSSITWTYTCTLAAGS